MPPSKSSTSELAISWPWWLRPLWIIVALSGLTLAYAILTPASTYRQQWGTSKYLVDSAPWLAASGLAAIVVGVAFTSGLKRKGGRVTIQLTERQIDFVRRTARVTFALTLLGYVFWAGVAASQGVGVGDLAAVLGRQEGAIQALKARSRPVGGLTTFTQLGPVAVVASFVLRRLGRGGRGIYVTVIALALMRTIFYAERLALLEVMIPLVAIACLTTRATGAKRAAVWSLPVLALPATWGVFAASEYTRSWVYYQTVVPMGFVEWSITRLLGYYATAWNNSALFFDQFTAMSPTPAPYYTLWGFWEMPLVSAPTYGGTDPQSWWAGTLLMRANPEFNNLGGIVPVLAEFGPLVGLALLVTLGAILGAVFAAMTRGSLPALLALPTLLVGVMELPRILYWTQGRAVPIILALLVIGFAYPKARAARKRPVPLAAVR